MNSTALVPHGYYAIGDARYQPHERLVTRDGAEYRLEPRIAGLLDHLSEHAGEIVSRDALLDAVWGDEGSDEALTQAVSKLRQALGNREIIRTEPRQGYRLTVVPAALPVDARETALRSPELQSEKAYPAVALRYAFAAGLLAGLLIAAVAWALFGPREVTVFEEVTAPADGVGEPNSRTVRCEGSAEECADSIPDAQ